MTSADASESVLSHTSCLDETEYYPQHLLYMLDYALALLVC